MTNRGKTAPALLLLAAAAALAGCGGGENDKAEAGAPAPAAAADGGGAPALQEIATKAGCSSITEDSEELYVREGGSCTAGSDDLTVSTFKDAKNRDAYLKIAKGFGGVYVVGDRWVIGVDDSAAAGRVQQKAGGAIR